MKKDLNQQVAVVTGATRGLGRTITLKLAEKGVKTAALARSATELADLEEEVARAGGTAAFFQCDVTDFDQLGEAMRKTHEKWGSLDILINNAGTGSDKTFEEITREEIDASIDVNLKGVIYATKQALPYMMGSGYGNIINISSIAALRGIAAANPNGIYAASKFGVHGFSQAMSQRLLKYNIHVAELCPGAIDTSWWDRWHYPHGRSAMIPTEYIMRIVELILETPENVLFKQANMVTTAEADIW